MFLTNFQKGKNVTSSWSQVPTQPMSQCHLFKNYSGMSALLNISYANTPWKFWPDRSWINSKVLTNEESSIRSCDSYGKNWRRHKIKKLFTLTFKRPALHKFYLSFRVIHEKHQQSNKFSQYKVINSVNMNLLWNRNGI
jgi:hypothetical protein